MKDNKITNQRYNPGKESISKGMYMVLQAYRKIESSNNKVLKCILHQLENSPKDHDVYEEPFEGNGSSVEGNYVRKYDKNNNAINGENTGSTTYYDFSNIGEGSDYEGIGDTRFSTVVHEMRHQYDHDQNNMGDNTHDRNNPHKNPAEQRAVYLENMARGMMNLKPRTTYNGFDREGGVLIRPVLNLSNPPNNKMP